MKTRHIASLFFALLLAAVLHAQHQPDGASAADPQDMNHATMEMGSHGHHHEDMGPHMKMSAVRDPQPGDSKRAQEIVNTARLSLERYKDVNAAVADGFKQFLPGVKQKMYHFTNWQYAIEAIFVFNPEHPTSLLYERAADNSYKLIGAMFTAPARTSEDELNSRVPLSQAQWHLHVNMCVPPKDKKDEMFKKNPRFGLTGSIATREECDAAGGTFKPQIFGWMVHMYPYEKTMDEIWSVERQKNTLIPSADNHADHH